MEQLLTVEEVARQLGYRPKSVYALLGKGVLPFSKFGVSKRASVRVAQNDLDAFVAKHYRPSFAQQTQKIGEAFK